MGADWYYPYILYGYAFDLMAHSSFRASARILYRLNSFLPSPFVITGILGSLHSRMEFANDDNREIDQYASVVVGFHAEADLEKMVQLRKDLAEFVQDNPIFTGFTLHPEPRFFTGITWPCGLEDDSFEEESVDSSDTSLDSTSDSVLTDADDTCNYDGVESETSVDLEASVDSVEAVGPWNQKTE
jgi:hypothetical protein